MHSVYSTDAFSAKTFVYAERETVRAVVGEAAERLRLAFLFSAVRRGELFRALDGVRGNVSVRDRNSSEFLLITSQEVADLLPIYMANLAEQGVRADGTPSPWLAEASEIGAIVAQWSLSTPPIFEHCRYKMRADTERNALTRYIAVTSGQANIMSEDVASLAEALPGLVEPMVLLGLITLASGDSTGASLLGRHAARGALGFPLPWDRRLTSAQWRGLTNLLVQNSELNAHGMRLLSCGVSDALESFKSPADLFERVAATGCIPFEDRLPTSASYLSSAEPDPIKPKSSGAQRFDGYLAALRDNAGTPRMQQYPDLSVEPFYDVELFPLALALEREAQAIVREYRALDHRNFHQESENIAREGNWDVLMLLEQGRRNEDISNACPETMRALSSAGCMKTLSGLAYFSRLAPGTKIGEHRGPTNMRLRCHLGIDVPNGCGLRVGGVEYTWQEGKCIVFNDALPHEAWNLGLTDRVVLVVDLWHSDLTGFEVEMLEGLQRYAFAHARNLEAYWKKNALARQPIEDGDRDFLAKA